MKRLLMGFATCALIMASCSQQEIMENVSDGQGSLSFAAGVGKQSATRAAEFNNADLKTAAKADANGKGDGIVLHAYQYDKDNTKWKTWYNDEVVYSNSQWKLEESVRFRNENETKYITYFPNTTTRLTNPIFENMDFTTLAKSPNFTYEVAGNSAAQEDLIAGITEVDAKKTDITLGMRHILSQVNFGTVGYKGAIIHIQNIKIVGVKNNATFTYYQKNTYPIGIWSTTAATASYDYYNYKNKAEVDTDASIKNNQHEVVGADVPSGDKYIFGDGGNAGPGKENTWYPTSASNGKWKQLTESDPKTTAIKNSLMLLPQVLTETAKVTFEYKITDVDGNFVAGAGSATTWAEGEFSLDFKTNTGDDKFYKGEWEQNYRYVYLIDFTDFLDGIALTFKVNVDMYPWENHDGDDGIINIMAAGQPSAANMNDENFVNNDTWYIASQSENNPDLSTPKKWAQVMRDEMWDLSAYDFANIDAKEKFTLSFKNVIFNTKETNIPTKITLTMPEGYTVTKGTGITMTGTYILSEGDRSNNATIEITNVSNYNKETTLIDGIKDINTNAQTIYYKGTEAVDLTLANNANLTDGNTITVKFTSSVIPTVGATTNGIWTWDAENRIATWKEVTWNNLDNTKTAVTGATANTVIYCNDETDIIDLATALEEPTTVEVTSVKVVFSKAATRTGADTDAGAWTYDTAAKTATWTKKTTP